MNVSRSSKRAGERIRVRTHDLCGTRHTCEWCFQDGARFERLDAPEGVTATPLDQVDLCRPCARLLRDAITQHLARPSS